MVARLQIVWFLGVLAVPFFASAQRATDTLDEIGVRRARRAPDDVRARMFSPGLKTSVLDSAVLKQYEAQSLGTLLAEQSSVFVKSYGYNGLATLNFRGASAAQSSVLWNGVPIQNAALGLTDVSTVPVSLIDKVSVLYGASAGLWGSGAVGGAVLLETDAPRFDAGAHRLDLTLSGGSFGQAGASVRGNLSGKRTALSIRAFGQRADNDFWVGEASGGVRDRQANARLLGGGVLARGAVRLSPRQTFSAHVWLQEYSREIPRATFESYSEKERVDRSARALLTYERGGRVALGAKLATLYDALEYRDPAALLESDNGSTQLYAEGSVRFGVHRLAQGGDTSRRAWADVLVFTPVHISRMARAGGSAAVQERYALAGAIKKTLLRGSLEAALTGRLERVDTQTVLLPGVNASYALRPWLSLRASAQRTYRAPTLSERYYSPGGNPDLKPEEGWGAEAGYATRFRNKSGLTLEHGATLYHRRIANWILWYGGAIWTPHNVAVVQSTGLEVENTLGIPIAANLTLSLAASGAYSRAVTAESLAPGDGSIGKQLPYTPRLVSTFGPTLRYKCVSASYTHFYTGRRFMTSDESSALPAYHTGNFVLSWEPATSRRFSASLRAGNLWGADYSVVAGRPMPGRHLLLSARIGIL